MGLRPASNRRGTTTTHDARLATVDRLRKIAAELASGRPVNDVWLGESLQRFLSEPGLTLEHAFGLASSRGKESWRTIEQRRRRENAIQSIEKIIGRPDLPFHERAVVLRAVLRHYGARWLRTDRQRNGKIPASYAGSVDEHLFAAFEAQRQLNLIAESDGNSAANHAFPMSDAALRRILSD